METFFCSIVTVEQKNAHYIEGPLDEVDIVFLNFILSTQHLRNRSCLELDPVEDQLIFETITEMAANGELD